MILEIQKIDVQKVYAETDENGKNLLQKLFDKSIFETKITDKVKSFEDACKVLGLNYSLSPHFYTADEIAYLKLKVIVKALNEGWTPDWSDDEEHKYYPWFDLEKGFVLYDVAYYFTLTSVSSRLCFKSRELAEYAANQFLDLYKSFMVIA
ncbi:MAG: hypothetical protein ACEQSR_03875 [Candidatus Methylacidiphilales bacterium]